MDGAFSSQKPRIDTISWLNSDIVGKRRTLQLCSFHFSVCSFRDRWLCCSQYMHTTRTNGSQYVTHLFPWHFGCCSTEKAEYRRIRTHREPLCAATESAHWAQSTPPRQCNGRVETKRAKKNQEFALCALWSLACYLFRCLIAMRVRPNKNSILKYNMNAAALHLNSTK